MIAAPVMLVAAGIAAGAAVACLRRSVVVRRIAPERVPGDAPPRRPTIPGPDWPWWPLAGVLVGAVAEGIIAAVVAGVAVKVGTATMRRRRDARVAAIVDEQLADAVRSFAAGMRAGLSVTQAIAFAAKEGEPPLAPTLARIVDGVSLGGSLDDALHGVGPRGGDRRRSAGGGRVDTPSPERRRPPACVGSGRLPRCANGPRRHARSEPSPRKLACRVRSSACCRSDSSRSCG